MNIIFDSRNPFHRDPVGAVKEENEIHFKIVLPRYLNCSAATLIVAADDSSEVFYNSMFWCGMKDDSHEMWECHFKPKKQGIFWYKFEIDTNSGKRFLLKQNKSGQAEIDNGNPWQITVFSKDFETPNWLLGGIMYQIFPDRFFSSGKKKTEVPEDRNISKKWGESPDWKPNENGDILNNDYFCGDLEGIIKKLDYLKKLGVTCIYLNPIFEAHSNHRYNIADYSKIDPLLGEKEDFNKLCEHAQKKGMRIILDGVFSHTGSDSVYFNKNKRYKSNGAYNSKKSKYYNWYNFSEWPNNYDAWWGFETLPETQETNPKFNEFINGKNGIARKWLKEGASGWRLDVADELPDPFLEKFREAVKTQSPDALIIGEVWEDASNKISYSHRRKFLLGNQLDSVMNYPFRNAILGFLKGDNAQDKMEEIMSIVENYPKPVLHNLMNPISTHDTERALTILGSEPANGRAREWQANQKLSEDERVYAIKMLKVASAMQYTLPGVPCIYYGDEVGVEGYRDPFNRTCYPWDNQDKDLLKWYQDLGKLRKHCPALKDGDIFPITADQDFICYIRKNETSTLLCAFNQSNQEKLFSVPDEFKGGKLVLDSIMREDYLVVPAEGCSFIEITKKAKRRSSKQDKDIKSTKKTTVKLSKSKKQIKASSKSTNDANDKKAEMSSSKLDLETKETQVDKKSKNTSKISSKAIKSVKAETASLDVDLESKDKKVDTKVKSEPIASKEPKTTSLGVGLGSGDSNIVLKTEDSIIASTEIKENNTSNNKDITKDSNGYKSKKHAKMGRKKKKKLKSK